MGGISLEPSIFPGSALESIGILESLKEALRSDSGRSGTAQ